MAIILQIPDSAFLAGGPFEGEDKLHTQIVLGIRTEVGAHMPVTVQPTIIDEWNFKPKTSGDMSDIMNYIDRGMLVIIDTTDSAQPEMTAAELITLYRTYWQEF
jgi:hypothetical protein